ncbi:hypothetical protein FIM25_00815 [Desulfobotulus mexicanus]|uniref:GDP-mannose 4,6-dehydratase n=2 Tax=Desulfobotulus mexicanus TaxID=2586642 RepID=A0A5Q4VJ09_9BACT|nr:hypothetical protein FIM25_00815 [Desulfobotulus mexicanus]
MKIALVTGCKTLWRAEGLDEEGFGLKTGEIQVRLVPRFYRPTEVYTLARDASRTKKALSWQPKTSLKELYPMMMEAAFRRNRDELCF